MARSYGARVVEESRRRRVPAGLLIAVGIGWLVASCALVYVLRRAGFVHLSIWFPIMLVPAVAVALLLRRFDR